MQITNFMIKDSQLGNMYPSADFIKCNFDSSGRLRKTGTSFGFGLRRKLLKKEYTGNKGEMRLSYKGKKVRDYIIYYKYLHEIDTVLWSITE
ncbi:hypothetical protein [Bacillus pumilus]|uniref:hypothetical protein n=1 Tax=Bacillus pumilus TaxID=1408 RepID=UPI0011A0FE90|nr:hypothetical protein [Bacillus pumilus]